MSFCKISISYQMLPLLLLVLLASSNADSGNGELNTYIIQMDHSQKPQSLTHESWHWTILKSLSHPVDDPEMLLYSYNQVIHGFSARLTQSQLFEVEKSPAHIATYQESPVRLLTTHTPKFLGLNVKNGLWPTSSLGEGVIIGLVDTGIWPESESFNDNGMPPVPQRWKGQCENGTGFSLSACNRKLIGARSFHKGLKATIRKFSTGDQYDESPRDQEGHGTHTSSTAAGSNVLGASHFGYAKGTARGMAPRAYVAMYKVQFATYESFVSDVLAGMDQAVSDGVDILSLSLGVGLTPYYNDVIAIASLSAIEKGVLVICAAGNAGPQRSSIYNGAPWITTVGASSIDRSFTATLILENGMRFEGTSYYPENVYISDAVLYYGQDNESQAKCFRGAYNRREVRGKIVLCNDKYVKAPKEALERAGALAGILITNISDSDMYPSDYSFPSMLLPPSSAALLMDYMAGATTAKVKSLKFVSTNMGIKPAPRVARFSSRGPDPINPGTLKPDILAPGDDVLAAVTPKKYMKLGKYNVYTNYALYSGTSMAAPHVAGVAALLKNVHPEWSPAAIKSAIMTTAYIKDNTGTILKEQYNSSFTTPLEFGAGHISPNEAMDPGLIYDVDFQDYVDFLCSLNYTEKQMRAVLRHSQWTCSSEQTDLNYPSFIGIFNAQVSFPAEKKFARVVTNVGDDTSIYNAHLDFQGLGSAIGMTITVEPDTLSFTKKYQKRSFAVTISINKEAPNVAYGFLRWIDQHNHVVSSPIVAVKS